MFSWDSLSYELLWQILAYLDHKDISQCQLTCRNWKRASQKTIYSTVDLKNNKQIRAFIWTITTCSFLGKCVKQLHIHYRFDTSSEHWDDLVKYCPNLQELRLAKTDSLFWAKIMRERYEGHWKQLSRLQFPTCTFELESYNMAAWAMRDTMKQLIISDNLSDISSYMKVYPFKTMLSRLSDFKQLETLAIKRYTSSALTELDSVFDSCTRLNELTVTLYPSLSDHQLETSQIKQIQSITRLEINALLYSEDVLCYIMNKFPNVKHFKLNTTQEHNIAWSARQNKPLLSPKTLETFAAYLRNMQTFDVNNLFLQNLKEAIPILQTKAVNDDLTLEFTFANGCQNKLQLVGGSSTSRDMRLTLKIDEHTTSLLSAVREIASSLVKLEIICHKMPLIDYSEANQDFKRFWHGYFLQDIFESCHHLHRLLLAKTTLAKLSPDLGIQNSIQTFGLIKTEYYPPILSELSRCLPRLQLFSIYDCTVCDQDGNVVDSSNNNFLIDVPHTYLKGMIFGSSKKGYGNQFFYLKLSTPDKETCYQCGYETIDQVTQVVFSKMEKKKRTLTLHIQVKGLEELQVNSHGFKNFYTLS